MSQPDALYDTFVKPVETERWGEYVVVTADGRMVFAPTLYEAVSEARKTLGRGTFAFKVGDRVVGKIR
jgi:hypothetical protein